MTPTRKRVYWCIAFLVWAAVAVALFYAMIPEDGSHPLDAIQLPEEDEESS